MEILNNLIIIKIFVFVFGLFIGSFLNACIYRLPLNLSVSNPKRSFCPICKNQIKFYDNIPILSYIFLKGKCRVCKAKISFRYPFIELLTGLMAICVFSKYYISVESLIYFGFIASLIVVIFIDIDYQIIPDEISLSGIVLGFSISFLSFFLDKNILIISPKESFLGILIGGGILWAIAQGYYLLKKQEGMGGGDIKLLAMIGAFLGVKGVLFTVFISSLTGTLIGIIIMLCQKKDLKFAVPFGPFLSIGAISYVFFGENLIDFYLQFNSKM